MPKTELLKDKLIDNTNSRSFDDRMSAAYWLTCGIDAMATVLDSAENTKYEDYEISEIIKELSWQVFRELSAVHEELRELQVVAE